MTGMRCRRTGMLLLVAAMATACVTPTFGSPDPDRAPTFRVTGERTLTVTAFSWCGEDFCADGMPSTPLPSIGRAEKAHLVLPTGEDWAVGASLTPAGDRCGRTFPAEVHGAGNEFVIEAAGPPGTYAVDAWAESARLSMSGAFRWITTVEGPLPNPRAEASVITEHDGALDSYGAELTLHDLATTPERATAKVIVTAGNGESLTIPLRRRMSDCEAPGTVTFEASETAGQQAAKLGPAPFEYLIDLRMDGTTYRGTSTWPGDLMPDYRPYTRVQFEPTLPPYRG